MIRQLVELVMTLLTVGKELISLSSRGIRLIIQSLQLLMLNIKL